MHLKKTLLLTATATFTMLFQACEKQKWEETKMLHDVPKRVSDENSPAKAPDAKPAPTTPDGKPVH